MKICLILEGCYPYVRGGVSAWTNDLIKSMSSHEFVLWVIGAQHEKRGKFVYQIPQNVVEINEVFLDESFDIRISKNKRIHFSSEETQEMLKLIKNEDPCWETLFNCYNVKGVNPVGFLKSENFLNLLRQMCLDGYPYAGFSDLFYTVRSIILPLIFLMGRNIPYADIYHSITAGYSGILGSLGAWKHNKPFIVTEHGIYTREREEEILRSKWVVPYFKDMWIAFFYMLSRCAYKNADVVTSLYERAKVTQIELGCDPKKCRVISNGVYCEDFMAIPQKKPNGYIDIGAIVRIFPIKDIKTMIYSFAELKHDIPNARLHILGDVDDQEYNTECLNLVEQLGVKDIFFKGNTDVKKYMRNLDFTMLSSISEAQPLAVLESMAAGRACVVTDVGSCRELVEGRADDLLGKAGICVPPMNKVALTDAMSRLCKDEKLRRQMGDVGKKRAVCYYNHETMIINYKELYERILIKWQALASS